MKPETFIKGSIRIVITVAMVFVFTLAYGAATLLRILSQFLG